MVLKAVFDGEVFRPSGPLPAGLKPGDEVDVQPPVAGRPVGEWPGLPAAGPPTDLLDGRSPVPGEPYAAFKFLLQNPLTPGDWEKSGWDGTRVHGGGEEPS